MKDMKRTKANILKAGVSLIAVLILLSGTSMGVNFNEEEINTPSDCGCGGCELEIEVIDDPYSRGLSMIIKNVGDEDCIDVEWKISIEGGLLGLINKTVNGTIDCIKPGEIVIVSSGIIFGFGPITITISVENDGFSFEESTDAWIIFFFMRIG